MSSNFLKGGRLGVARSHSPVTQEKKLKMVHSQNIYRQTITIVHVVRYISTLHAM